MPRDWPGAVILMRRHPRTAKLSVLAVAAAAMAAVVAGANDTAAGTGSQSGGLPIVLIVGVFFVLVLVAGLGVAAYALMTGRLSMDDLMPGSDSSSDTGGVQQPSRPQPPAAEQSPGKQGQQDGRQSRQQGVPAPPDTGSGQGTPQQSGQTSPQQGSKQRQTQPEQSGQQPNMQDLRRDTARIQAVLKNRREVPNRGEILDELEQAMAAVDSDDYQAARSSLDRIKQLLNTRQQ